MTIVSDANVRNGQPHIDGTDVTVQEVYVAYAREGLEPAEVANEFDVDLARVHEAIAYYYDHASSLRGRTSEKVAELTGGDEDETRAAFKAVDIHRPNSDADRDEDQQIIEVRRHLLDDDGNLEDIDDLLDQLDKEGDDLL